MKLRRKEEEDMAIDMSPMIDMVFLLLIFFIVASAIVKVEKVPIDVPEAIYAKVPEDETGRYIITVTEEGGMYLGPTSEEVTIEELAAHLIVEMEADPELRILVRSDKKVRYGANEKIMEACAEAGAMDLIFAAFEE